MGSVNVRRAGGKWRECRRYCGQLWRLSLAVIGTIGWSFSSVACQGSPSGVSQADTSRDVQVVSRNEVLFTPRLEAGEGGWCVTTVRSVNACPTFALQVFQEPIIVEDWSGQSSSSTTTVNEAVVVASSEVAAVELDKYAPVPTRAGVGLPDHLRAAIVELRGNSGGHVLGVAVPPPFPTSHFTALDGKGEPMRQVRTPGPPLEFRVPSRRLVRSEKAPLGICSLTVRGTLEFVFGTGRVMIVVEPHRNIRGREFVDCVRKTYLVGKTSIEANVLLDAARPGATPASLPGMQLLRRHRGVFRGPGVGGEMVARRIAGAWLVVTKGEGLDQRLTLLEHLHAQVHL
jgi:hypothetical protein